MTRLPDSAAGLGIIPVAAAWGSSFIFIRVALPALGTFGVAEARALLGGLAVTGLVFARAGASGSVRAWPATRCSARWPAPRLTS